MKRFVTTLRKPAVALLAIAALAMLATSAFAAVLMSDSFTYPNGDLTANPNWLVYSGTPPTDIQVSSGRVLGNHANAPDDHRLFAIQPTTSKTYACFDVIIPNPGAGAPKPVYFCELKDNGASNLVSRVYVLPIAGGWTFGISHSTTSATAGVTPWSATTLLYDHKYNVVINYDPVNKSSTLWVDPATESSASVTDTNPSIAALAVQGFGFRQSSTASTLPAVPAYTGTLNITYSVDNLGVGTTFTDACAQFQSTPTTKSTWGAVKAHYR